MNNANPIVIFAIAAVVLLILFVILIGLIQFYNEFITELQYLSSEIERTDGEERAYWLSRKRRLWLSLLPFVKY
ncbi:MAG: hypothetical protein IJO89_04790 [Clostridia bacterium]|nr:hypothetical protein [Clostridia bacterium]MBQ9958347.1 hypothetical protein [Clostridia bacterium]